MSSSAIAVDVIVVVGDGHLLCSRGSVTSAVNRCTKVQISVELLGKDTLVVYTSIICCKLAQRSIFQIHSAAVINITDANYSQTKSIFCFLACTMAPSSGRLFLPSFHRLHCFPFYLCRCGLLRCLTRHLSETGSNPLTPLIATPVVPCLQPFWQAFLMRTMTIHSQGARP